MQQPILDLVNDEPRALYMQVAKEGPLTIRQLIEGARGLHPGPKRVLAEICNLHEKGGRECYDANNNHLAKKLGMTVPMVSRHIHSLAERGLIVLSPKKNGQKRTLTPDALLQAAYRSGESGKITEVVKSILESGKITSLGDESGKKEFTEVVNKNYQFGKHNRSLIKEEEYSLQVAGLQQQVDSLTIELSAANAANSQRIAEVLALKEEVKAINEKWAKGKAKGRELYEANQQTISSQAAEILALKAELAAPKTTAVARAVKPIASLDPKDYRLPHWATDQFIKGFAEWLAFRQKHRAGKLLPESIQRTLNELEGYDELFCCFLFEKAMKAGNQGLTFDDTPARFEGHKAARKPVGENGVRKGIGGVAPTETYLPSYQQKFREQATKQYR